MLCGKTLQILSQIIRIGKLDNKFMCHETQAHFITIFNATHFVSWAWGGPTRRTFVGMKTFPWRVKLLRRQVGKSGKTSSFLQINSPARLTEIQLQNTFIVVCAFAASFVWSNTGVHTWISWISDWFGAATKHTSLLAGASFQHGCQVKNPDAPWWRHRPTSSVRFGYLSGLNIFIPI